jgi:alpha-galactosidase
MQIQEGVTRLFPSAGLSAWVTDELRGDFSLDFRFHVSMAGALGVGGNLLEWSAAERARAAEHIAFYKQLRPVIATGDLFRLRSPRDSAISAVGYVGKDKAEAVVFVYRLRPGRLSEEPVVIRPAGLDPEAVYALDGTDTERSGKAWAEVGVAVALKDDSSTILRFSRV